MKKAIEILEQHIMSYRSAVELYEDNPRNQAITEYSAKEAAKNIVSLQAAVAALKTAEQNGQIAQHTQPAIAFADLLPILNKHLQGCVVRDIFNDIPQQHASA